MTSSPIASVSTPTPTSATISPFSRTGTTARTERPSVPVVVSVTVRPRAAGSNVPTNRLPIRLGVGCVKRIPSGRMIVMKLTRASVRSLSANG